MFSGIDNLWMFYHALKNGGAKRWFSFNCERFMDENPVKKIGYLTNLNMSPTSDTVVRKTLEIAQTTQTIANECSQDFIITTFDLAIAAKAYKI